MSNSHLQESTHKSRNNHTTPSSNHQSPRVPFVFTRKLPKINYHFNFQRPPVVKMKLKQYYEQPQNQKFEFDRIKNYFKVFQNEKKNEYKEEYIGKVFRLLNRKTNINPNNYQNQKKYYIKRKELENQFGRNKGNVKFNQLLYGNNNGEINNCKDEIINHTRESKNSLNNNSKQFYLTQCLPVNLKFYQTNDKCKNNVELNDDSSYDSKENEDMIRKTVFKKLDIQFNFFQKPEYEKIKPINPINKIQKSLIDKDKTIKNLNTSVENNNKLTLTTREYTNSFSNTHSNFMNTERKPRPKQPSYFLKNYYPHINKLTAFEKKKPPITPNHKKVAFGSVFTVLNNSKDSSSKSPRKDILLNKDTINSFRAVTFESIIKKHHIEEKVEKVSQVRMRKIKQLLNDFEF